MPKSDKNSENWLTQMHVFPDQGANENAEFEHDQPYVVEYLPPHGERRTRVLTDEEVADVREKNLLPPERVTNADGEDTNITEEGGE